MSASNLMSSGDCLDAIAEMVEHNTDLQYVVQQARLSRLKMGSILERLESLEPDLETLERLRDHTESIAYEVDCFALVLRELMEG
jgi:hypothetical protein